MLPVFEYRDINHLLDNVEQALLAPVKDWEAGYDRLKALEEEGRRKDVEIHRLRAQIAALSGSALDPGSASS